MSAPQDSFPTQLRRFLENDHVLKAAWLVAGVSVGVLMSGAWDRGANDTPAERAGDLLARTMSLAGQEMDHQITDKDIPGIVSGALGSLDRYSGYVSPQFDHQLGDTDRSADASTPRIGTIFTVGEKGVRIEAVAPGSPAEQAGLRPGDRLISINGTALEGEDRQALMEATKALFDKANASGKPFDLEIARVSETLQISVTARALHRSYAYDLPRKSGYAHVLATGFYPGLAEDIAGAISHEQSIAPIKGVVLDLRGNGGGLTTEAKKVAELFLEKGSLIYSVHGRTIRDEHIISQAAPRFPDLPLAILINKDSASASEIVSGAIQGNHRGILVGHKSFGKGSIQGVFHLGADEAVKLTIAHYRDAAGNKIDKIGLTPNVLDETKDEGGRAISMDDDHTLDLAVDALEKEAAQSKKDSEEGA